MFSSSDAAQTLHVTPGSSDAAAGSWEWLLQPQFTQQREWLQAKRGGEREHSLQRAGGWGLGLGVDSGFLTAN